MLTLCRSLLLGIWYQLSDVQLSQCLYRDLLLRKFCHLELDGPVLKASTIGRFRNQLVKQDIWGRLLAEINDQLETQNIIMTKGVSTSSMQHWLKPPRQVLARELMEAPNGILKQAGMSRMTAVPARNQPMAIPRLMKMVLSISKRLRQAMPMIPERGTLLLGNESALYADFAYSSNGTREKLEKWGLMIRYNVKAIVITLLLKRVLYSTELLTKTIIL